MLWRRWRGCNVDKGKTTNFQRGNITLTCVAETMSISADTQCLVQSGQGRAWRTPSPSPPNVVKGAWAHSWRARCAARARAVRGMMRAESYVNNVFIIKARSDYTALLNRCQGFRPSRPSNPPAKRVNRDEHPRAQGAAVMGVSQAGPQTVANTRSLRLASGPPAPPNTWQAALPTVCSWFCRLPPTELTERGTCLHLFVILNILSCVVAVVPGASDTYKLQPQFSLLGRTLQHSIVVRQRRFRRSQPSLAWAAQFTRACDPAMARTTLLPKASETPSTKAVTKITSDVLAATLCTLKVGSDYTVLLSSCQTTDFGPADPQIRFPKRGARGTSGEGLYTAIRQG